MSTEVTQEIVNLWGRGERLAAQALSEELLKSTPDCEQTVVFHSGLLLHLSKYLEARSLLESEKWCNSARLQANLSIAQRGCGDLESAVKSAERAVSIAPELISGWNALAIALMELGRVDDAEQRLLEGLVLHPDSAPLMHHLTEAMLRRGVVKAAAIDHGMALLFQAGELVSQGNSIAAESLLRQAVERYPDHANVHRMLGVLLLQFDRNTEALSCFRSALERDPSCAISNYFLQVAEGNVPTSGSAIYVQKLFDSYADRFDHHLIEGLHYRVPQLIRQRVLGMDKVGRLDCVLDLGCGTGLMGAQLAGHVKIIDGVDLSGKMLEKARSREIYRDLVEADIRDFLGTGSVSRFWNAIIAADVFCYCGYLDDILTMARKRIEQNGLLAFSVEASEEKDVEVLPSTGRYRHGRAYIERILMATNFKNWAIDTAVLRTNRGEDVHGYIVVARV